MKYPRENWPYPQPWEWIIENIQFKTSSPFYVDVGANDGLQSSNTGYLEMDCGWGGICIEPHPEAFERLKLNRNCKKYNCCISEETGEVDFLVVTGYAEMLSGIYKEYDPKHIERIDNDIQQAGGSKQIVKVPSRTLSSILDENSISKVDYLSIDTEGSELSVLKSIDFNRFDVNVISVENNNYHNLVYEYLTSNGYEFLLRVCGDEIYMKK